MADIFWTGNGDRRSWSDPDNWNTDTVPTALDNVTIDNATVTLDTNATVATLNLSSASFTNLGQLNVTTLNWIDGSLVGSGSINIPEIGTLNISGGAKRLDPTINNAGNATWTATGDISGAGTINNSGQFDIQNSQSIEVEFNNTGTVTKSADNGTSSFLESFSNNGGIVDIQIGSISLDDLIPNFNLSEISNHTSTGNFNLAGGTTLEVVAGNLSLNAGTTFTGPGLVKLSEAGVITLNNLSAPPINIPNFTQDGGTLNGAGSLNITDNFSWLKGTQSGTGTTTVATGANGNFSGINATDLKEFNARTFSNEGTITWTGLGDMLALNGATFNNSGTFDIQNSQSFDGDSDGSTSFNNSGILTKSADAGDSSFDDNAFNNTGTVNVQVGKIIFDNGSSTGAYNIAAGATVEFGQSSSGSNTNTLNQGTTFTGEGLVQLTIGTLNVETPADSEINVPNFEQTGGTLSGTGNFRVSAPTPVPGQTPQTSSFTWSGGTQSGTGTTTVGAGTTATINEAEDKILTERTFNNESTISWAGRGDIFAGNGAAFNNIGTFDIQNAQSFVGEFSEVSTFNNTGTVIKSLDTETSFFANNTFNNTGTVDVQVGELIIDSDGGASTGTYNIVEGATVEFSGILEGQGNFDAFHTLNEGTVFTGEGLLRLRGGILNIETSPEAEITVANFEHSFGTLTGDGNFRVAAPAPGEVAQVSTFTWSGGIQSGTGTTTISNSTTGTISGLLEKSLTERTFNNEGAITWTDRGSIFAENGAIFNNNGTFNISNSATYDGDSESTAEQFNNAGSVVKTSSGDRSFDTLFNDVVFTNSGTIEAQEGVLSIVRETFVDDAGTITETNGTVDLTQTNVISPNQPPTLDVNAGLTIEDGTTLPILNTNLEITDIEDSPEEITYTVETLPTVGSLLLNGTALAVGDTFTQANINGSQLLYQNNDGGGDVGDSFVFTATDGEGGVIGETTFNITVEPPVNDPPVLSINGGVNLNDGANETISSAVLTVTDPDNAPGELTYTVTELPTEGDLLLEGTELEVNDTFTQADINADLLTYANTEGGDETSDNFTFTVSDGEGGEIAATPFNITVNQPPPNQPPVLAPIPAFSLDDGDNVTISNAVLAVTDTDNAPGELTYTVTAVPSEGDLLLDGTELEVNDTFTQADINADLLTYANTEGGDETSDNFTFTVSDGEGGEIAATAFNITVNQPPPPPVNEDPVLAPIPAFSLDDGANVIISEAVLEVTDPDNAPGELTYTVTELPSEGDLLLDGTELEVNDTFTQADINADLLTYANTEGGDETSDNFTFTVSDGAGGEIGATGFNITVNQPATPPVEPPPVNEDPVLATNTGVSLDDGDNVTISNAVLAVTDTDNAPGELTYTVTDLPTEGDLLLDGTELEVNDTFTQANINAGLLTYANTEGGDETSDNFTFTVSDGAGGEIGATDFNIAVSQAINGTNGNDELSEGPDSDIINGLGGNDNISGFGGNDTLRGGAGNDEVLGNRGNDRINGGEGDDTIIGGIGNDFLLGVDGADVLIGGRGNDIMLGGNGADILEGRPGRDRMNGGLGADTMTGGVSRDLFIFNTNEAFSTEIGVDTIVDFTPGQDLILLDRTTFVGLTAVDSRINASEFEVVTTNADAATSNALITYNSTTGALFYNQNGSAGGFGNGAQFALLENTPVLELADFQVR